MISARDKRAMDRFGLTELVESLYRGLMELDGVEDVEFDLDGFYDDIEHVIFLPKYSIPVELEDYYSVRKVLLTKILEVAASCGLCRTQDRIEDYGQHFYIVTMLAR